VIVILPDVNVLIYAFRSDSADHQRYNEWLTDTINGPAAYGIAPQVLASLIRICTHPKIFKEPTQLSQTLQFCRVLLEAPNATLVTPGDQHWSIFQAICATSKAYGNLVQDAWLAALAIESGCEWITTDNDFSRFPNLHFRRPF
jgi:toxin-antitoxin system PIN domain toxin